MKRSGNKPSEFKGVSLFVVLFLLMTMFSSLFIGKIISTSIMDSLENPYHLEKVLAEVVRVKHYEPPNSWNDYYIRYAQYVDEETGVIYEALITGEIYDKAEAESYIGKKVYILIDREYGIATEYRVNAESGGAPIDLIVYSVLSLFCLSISVFCIVKITKKNKKHWIWIAVYILLMLGLAAYVAYASFDMNYIKQLTDI